MGNKAAIRRRLTMLESKLRTRLDREGEGLSLSNWHYGLLWDAMTEEELRECVTGFETYNLYRVADMLEKAILEFPSRLTQELRDNGADENTFEPFAKRARKRKEDYEAWKKGSRPANKKQEHAFRYFELRKLSNPSY